MNNLAAQILFALMTKNPGVYSMLETYSDKSKKHMASISIMLLNPIVFNIQWQIKKDLHFQHQKVNHTHPACIAFHPDAFRFPNDTKILY